MALATLLQDGDSIEKATWPFMRDFFPHYEDFWRTHIVPLRSTGSIHPRREINEDFEFLAMQHYSLYVNLGKAHSRILGPEAMTSYGFPDDIYAVLQRVAELGLKVVGRFEELFHKCVGQTVTVDTLKISKLIDRIDGYRNLIHKELLAVQGDPSGRLFVPRPEKLEKYSKWTDVLYHASSEDFVDVHKQLVDDFVALCSALETTWKILCEQSKLLAASKTYLEMRAQGESVPVVNLMVPGASGTFTVSSNSASNVVASPVPGVIMIRKPGV